MDSALSAFTKALEGGNEPERWLAAKELALHYLKKGKYKEIEELLEHKDAKVREGTAKALRRLDIAPLVSALVRALKDQSVEVRRGAADALNFASEVRGDVAFWEYRKCLDLTSAIPALTKALEDADSMVRWLAAGALEYAAESGLDITDSIPALTKALEDKKDLTRRYAAGALSYAACLGQDITSALAALRKRLKDGSQDEWEFNARGNAARAFIFHYVRQGDWKKVEESLESKDVEDRKNAARALQIAAWNKVDIFPLIPALSKALIRDKDYEDYHIRWDAARALRYAVNNGIDISSAISNLIKALSDPYTIAIDNTLKPIIRRNASAALTTYYINKKDWKNIEGLLKHNDVEVKRGADIAFNDAVKERKEIPDRFDDFISPENSVLQDRDKRRKKLEELLRHNEDWTRVDIAQGLAASAHNGLDISPAISDLTNWLESKEEVLRKNAAETLGDAAKEGLDISLAIPSLAKLLSDKDEFIIGAACWGLVAHYINKKDWKNIEELLNHETDHVREGTAEALSQAAQHQLDITPVIPGLVHALSDKNSHVRCNAVMALWEAGSWSEFDISPAIPALKKALKDEDEHVRSSAKSALETIEKK